MMCTTQAVGFTALDSTESATGTATSDIIDIGGPYASVTYYGYSLPEIPVLRDHPFKDNKALREKIQKRNWKSIKQAHSRRPR